jgi:chromosome segregation ATPase
MQRDIALKQEINTTKSMLNSKSNEISDLSFNVQKMGKQADQGDAEKAHLKEMIAALEMENDDLKRGKDRIEDECAYALTEKNAKLEELTNKFNDIEKRIDNLHGLYTKEKEKGMQLEGTLEKRNGELQKLKENALMDNSMLEDQLKRKEYELIKLTKKEEEYNSLIKYKEAKEEEIKRQLTDAEISSLEYKDQLRKTQKEKETYEALADKRKREAEMNKKLRESQLTQSIDLLKEKKNLEGKLLEKEIEANRAKRDLNIIKDTHEDLVEDKFNKEKEIEALKEHLEVLSSQNQTVYGLLAKQRVGPRSDSRR